MTVTDDSLWLRCAEQAWGEHWQSEMARYFGKSRQWVNHMVKGRHRPPPDIMIYLRELLVRQRQQSLDLIAEIDATPGAQAGRWTGQ
ncbi:hypothetical protein [Methylocella sp.]|uniref:hypothetical protein n=1 Tax=Methylocella sp. TaxID=1978226 RepID=UPI0035B1A979